MSNINTSNQIRVGAVPEFTSPTSPNIGAEFGELNILLGVEIVYRFVKVNYISKEKKYINYVK